MANYDPIYLSLNDDPRDILAAMDDLVARRAKTTTTYQQRRWLPWALVLAGLFFLLLDFLLGYNSSLFMLVCVGWWIVAVVVWLALRRNRAGGSLAPEYQTAREVFYTLRDDVAPKKFFFGHLDLTGPQQTSKVARTAQNALGRNVSFYRDEWLSLKTKLYDGNLLRVSAVQRMKVRDSYTKRSASGKLKMKSALVKDDRQQLSVRLSVNPQVYDVATMRLLQPGTRIGTYTIVQCTNDGGIVNVVASAAATRVTATDIVSVLHAVYDQLQRKTGAA
jgi:hypothetical protein